MSVAFFPPSWVGCGRKQVSSVLKGSFPVLSLQESVIKMLSQEQASVSQDLS